MRIASNVGTISAILEIHAVCAELASVRGSEKRIEIKTLASPFNKTIQFLHKRKIIRILFYESQFFAYIILPM